MDNDELKEKILGYVRELRSLAKDAESAAENCDDAWLRGYAKGRRAGYSISADHLEKRCHEWLT